MIVSRYRTRQNSPTSQYVLFNKLSNIEPGSGRGDPDPAFPLLFHENPASRTFSSLSRIPLFLSQKYIKKGPITAKAIACSRRSDSGARAKNKASKRAFFPALSLTLVFARAPLSERLNRLQKLINLRCRLALSIDILRSPG